MNKLDYFNRRAKLVLKFYKQNDLLNPYHTVTYQYYVPSTNTKVYDNVRISFEIQKYPSKGLDCNGTAKILIYNISEDTNNMLADESLVKDVELQVSYGDKAPETIYMGRVNTSYVTYNNNDMITYMWCFSFSSSLLGDKYSKTFPIKNLMSYKRALELIIDDLFKDAKSKLTVNTKNLDEDTKTKFLQNGIQNETIDGLKGMLERISKDLSCDYYIEGKVIYLGSFKTAKKSGLVSISPQNGLYNNPNVTNSGLEVKTILNPKIRMFVPIKIEADFAEYSGTGYNFTDATKKVAVRYLEKNWKSFYANSQVIYVSHVGDTHTNTWETRLTTITLNETINPKAIKVE